MRLALRHSFEIRFVSGEISLWSAYQNEITLQNLLVKISDDFGNSSGSQSISEISPKMILKDLLQFLYLKAPTPTISPLSNRNKEINNNNST